MEALTTLVPELPREIWCRIIRIRISALTMPSQLKRINELRSICKSWKAIIDSDISKWSKWSSVWFSFNMSPGMNGWGGAVDDPTSQGEEEGKRQLKAVLRKSKGKDTGTDRLRRVGISVRGTSSGTRLVRQINPLVSTSSLWEELSVFSISPITHPTLWPTILDSLQSARQLTCLTLSHERSFDQVVAPADPPAIVTLETVREIRYRDRVQDGISTPNAETLSLFNISIGAEEFRSLCRSLRRLKTIELQAVFVSRTWAGQLSPLLATIYSEMKGVLRTDVALFSGPINVAFTGRMFTEKADDGFSDDDSLLLKYLLAYANVRRLELHLQEEAVEASFEALFVDHRWFREARTRGLTALHIQPERPHRIRDHYALHSAWLPTLFGSVLSGGPGQCVHVRLEDMYVSLFDMTNVAWRLYSDARLPLATMFLVDCRLLLHTDSGDGPGERIQHTRTLHVSSVTSTSTTVTLNGDRSAPITCDDAMSDPLTSCASVLAKLFHQFPEVQDAAPGMPKEDDDDGYLKECHSGCIQCFVQPAAVPPPEADWGALGA